VQKRSAVVDGTEVQWLELEGPDRLSGADSDIAPPVYIHGVPDSGRSWLPFLERTGGYALDLPGFGSSAKPANFDYSIPGYARFLSEWVDHVGLDRFSLVVHDWGAVGLALAQERPELIERLVVIDVVPFLPGYRWHPVARAWRRPLVGELFMGTSTKWGMRRLARAQKSVPEELIDGFVDQVWEHFDHGTQRAILKLYRSAPEDVLARAGERLGDITAPALIVWGANDHYLPTEFAHAHAEALGGEARVEIVDGAGHWPWLDRPEVVDMVEAFLRG
jgi:pimeloyl-ACP methyl ester carboxylesterase